MRPCVSFAPMRRTISLVALFSIALTSLAIAQPAGGPNSRKRPEPPVVVQPPPPPPPPAPVPPRPTFNWDSSGWTKLGERDVNGRVDKDRIQVGRYEGKFSKLTIVVRDSDLELMDFAVKFARGPEWRPQVQHYFRENQRTRVIDVPGDDRVIKYIDIKYRNIAGGGRAKIEVWGMRGDATPPTPPRPVVVNWDSSGWTKLGERDVNGRVDKDRIDVGRYEGKFSKLTIVVRDSDLEMIDFSVKFARGPEWRPTNMAHYFRENQRTRAIDFPGDDRSIKYIDFKYRNLPGGGRAKVEVWGMKTESANNAPRPGGAWDQQGWTMLGERTVDGRGRRGDADRIEVGRAEGKFRKLTVVVLDSSLDMQEMEIKFGRGENFRPEVRQVFNEGSRTRVIDLPGDDRVIKWIEFKYKNLPGGGKARVQVWAR